MTIVKENKETHSEWLILMASQLVKGYSKPSG